MTDYATPNFSTDLTGQVALVTGTTSGLGNRFARVLAKCGAKVVLTGRRVDRLESLAREIRADGGICEPFAMDVSKRTSIRAVVDQAEKKLGTITILVNNAGVPDAQRAVKMSDELVDGVIDVNLKAPFILSCEIARRLMEKKIPGRIVNISSIAAFDSGPNSAVSLYSITKAGVVRMTEVLALEWAKFGINVNCIAPGAFSTEMLDGLIQRVGDISANYPRKRICYPPQMDSTLLFLVSPSSECVTGAIVKIDDAQANR